MAGGINTPSGRDYHKGSSQSGINIPSGGGYYINNSLSGINIPLGSTYMINSVTTTITNDNDITPTYYVSSTGNDNNNGTSSATPWQTLTKVNSHSYSAGDVIAFKRGDTFYGTLSTLSSGTNGNPIIYTAYGSGTAPIITGFSNITSWTDKGNNIWESTNAISTLDTCNMVAISNVNIPMAKIPKVFVSTATNLALNKTIVASSTETNDFLPEYANDGDSNTRWSSNASDGEWIYVDLGSTHTIAQIQLAWEAAYPSAYRVEVSNNLSSWTTIYTTSSNTGGTNNLLNLNSSGRYVRVTSITRATEYGISLWEFAVYDTAVEVSDNVWTTTNGYYTIASHADATSLTSNYLTGNPNWSGAQVVTRSNNWTYHAARVSSQTTDTLHLSSDLEMLDNFGFFIQDDIRCCTEQNDWYYNPSTKKLSIYSTSQPSNVKVANIENLIDIGASYVTIQNLNFIGSNGSILLSRWTNTNLSMIDCQLSFSGEDAVYCENMTHTTFTGNIIKNTNGVGINMGNSYYHTITDNNLENISIYPGMKASRNYGSSFGAITFASNSNCLRNVIKNTGYNGIGFGGQNILIKHNFVDTFCTIQSDGGAIYTFKGDLANVRITENVLINGIGNTPGSPSNFGAAGIYLDEESGNCEVDHNSIANTYWYGIQCNLNIGGVNFHHNTLYNASYHQFYASYWEVMDYPLNTLFNYNTLVAISPTQDCLGFGFANRDPDTGEEIFIQSYSLNNNIYANLITNDNIVNSNNSLLTLPQWKAKGEDANSVLSSQLISSIDDVTFYYNETSVDKTIELSSNMIDPAGVTYTTSITLAPFTSKVLMIDN